VTGLLRALGGAACATWAFVAGVAFVGTREPAAGFVSLVCVVAAWWWLGGAEES